MRAAKPRRRLRRITTSDTAVDRPPIAAEPPPRPVRGAISGPAPTSNDRLWRALLVGGAAVACAFLGLQVADLIADRTRPTFFRNDLYNALGSLAMLAIVGAFAWRRRRQSGLGKPNQR